MEKLNIIIGSCNLYIDGNAEDAKLANETLEEMSKEALDKPDWYYRAKAKHTLGIL